MRCGLTFERELALAARRTYILGLANWFAAAFGDRSAGMHISASQLFNYMRRCGAATYLSRSTQVQSALNSAHDFGVFTKRMLPNPNYPPAVCAKPRRNVTIARTVYCHFPRPEFLVCTRCFVALRASMPKASVDEDNYSFTSKSKVWMAEQW